MTAGGDWREHGWKRWVLLAWALTAAWLLFDRWPQIRWFALGDTDDNMRMMQVRALLGGQGWFDLRQHRLAPPIGADMHWSRLVDLPIAGIMLLLKPLLGGRIAEQTAVAVAPLLPMLIAMGALAATVRRLVHPWAYLLALALLLCAHSARGMWMPLRIDHHGWQLALLALAAASFAVTRPARGGLLLGIASALSLTIGLEMLIYLAAAGAIVALMWVRDGAQAPRLAAYGVSLGGGTALGYLLFASDANRAAVCDALSPVWLSAMVAAGAAAFALARLSPVTWPKRLGIAALAGALLATGFALAWPHCLGRLEGVSPELQAMWLDRVREALPLYRHDRGTIAAVASLPLFGLIGYGWTLWRLRRDEAALTPWAALSTLALLATALLLWQSRAGPAAQLLAVPGATALGWALILRARASGSVLVRVLGTVGVFTLAAGLLPQYATRLIPVAKSGAMKAVSRANNRCPTLAALKPVALQPRGRVLTHVDLGPRLITVTHHDAVAGPYHRNQAAILDVMKAFRGTAENAWATVTRRGLNYVLICPGLSETTIYRAEAPRGFYVQLTQGRVPAWLEPVALPTNSPYRMWRVR